MNSNKLISIDDADLDMVAGGGRWPGLIPLTGHVVEGAVHATGEVLEGGAKVVGHVLEGTVGALNFLLWGKR